MFLNDMYMYDYQLGIEPSILWTIPHLLLYWLIFSKNPVWKKYSKFISYCVELACWKLPVLVLVLHFPHTIKKNADQVNGKRPTWIAYKYRYVNVNDNGCVCRSLSDLWLADD